MCVGVSLASLSPAPSAHTTTPGQGVGQEAWLVAWLVPARPARPATLEPRKREGVRGCV